MGESIYPLYTADTPCLAVLPNAM